MSDGSYQIGNIAPGSYDLFAFDRNDEDVYYDADFLRRAIGTIACMHRFYKIGAEKQVLQTSCQAYCVSGPTVLLNFTFDSNRPS